MCERSYQLDGRDRQFPFRHLWEKRGCHFLLGLIDATVTLLCPWLSFCNVNINVLPYILSPLFLTVFMSRIMGACWANHKRAVTCHLPSR